MKFPVSSLSEEEVVAHKEKEKQDINKMLEDCARICRSQFKVEKLYIEKENIESGLVELISQHKIERLVMGAASDKKNSSFSLIFDFRKMTEPRSKKASFVRQNAPAYCQIWFTCKGQLIYTREAIKQPQLNDEGQNGQANAKSQSNKFSSELSTSSRRNFEESFDRSSVFSLSPVSSYYQSSASASDSTSYHSGTEDRETSFRSLTLSPKPEGKRYHLLSPNAPNEGHMDDALYNKFGQAIKEAEIAKHEAIEESMRRRKAEKDAIEAINKANATESMYYEELRRRKELEEELAKAKAKFKRHQGS